MDACNNKLVLTYLINIFNNLKSERATKLTIEGKFRNFISKSAKTKKKQSGNCFYVAELEREMRRQPGSQRRGSAVSPEAVQRSEKEREGDARKKPKWTTLTLKDCILYVFSIKHGHCWPLLLALLSIERQVEGAPLLVSSSTIRVGRHLNKTKQEKKTLLLRATLNLL